MAYSLAIAVFLAALISSVLSINLEKQEHREHSSTRQEGKHWALLVAGSNSWGNYRHQSDICHAYQILHSHGIPDENIVVMMYDDIAFNMENPTPGVIINKPNGPNVYEGVVKDYTRNEVTPKKFIEVLKGNREFMKDFGSGKVIDSGPNDHVFVYFSDHGAPGIVAFPTGEMLTARMLNDAISYMHQNNKYRKMVLYIESCESGSMFRKLLPNDIEVYATTASNYNESSYACYLDSKLGTYLGDVYSVKWMENSDKADLDVETLLQQFVLVKRETNTSHVQKYGDMSFDKDKLDEYQGEDKSAVEKPKVPATQTWKYDAVPAPDVPVAILEHRLKDAKSAEERKGIQQQLDTLIKMRLKIKATAEEIVTHATQSEKQKKRVLSKAADPRDYDCYKAALERFSEVCFSFGEYEHALRHVYVLSNLCEEQIPTESILTAINSVCGSSGKKFY